MATQVLTTQFQIKRGLAEAWDRINPILAEGEPGWALDTHVLKIGDGTTAWNDLNAISGSDISLSPDGLSLAYNDKGDICVIGFEAALANQIPIKGKNGSIVWMSLSPVALSGDIADLTQRETIKFYCGSATDLVEE